MLFIILYHPFDLPNSQVPEGVTIFYPHLGALGPDWL